MAVTWCQIAESCPEIPADLRRVTPRPRKATYRLAPGWTNADLEAAARSAKQHLSRLSVLINELEYRLQGERP